MKLNVCLMSLATMIVAVALTSSLGISQETTELAPTGGQIMKYTRLYADANGESHFEDIEIELLPVNFAPPAPPLNLSEFKPCNHYGFLSGPVSWSGSWHPTPVRQIFFYLAGEVEAEVSDGEVRRFGPGSVVLVEDTTGKGHKSRGLGTVDVLMAVVQLD